MNQTDIGCTDFWCRDYRTKVARRADTAERAVRAHEHTIRALRAEIARLKEPPEPDGPAEKYVEFRWRAWVLLGLILMVAGAGLLGVAYLIDQLSASTTFNEVRKPG